MHPSHTPYLESKSGRGLAHVDAVQVNEIPQLFQTLGSLTRILRSETIHQISEKLGGRIHLRRFKGKKPRSVEEITIRISFST
jgi:hypothetical protein